MYAFYFIYYFQDFTAWGVLKLYCVPCGWDPSHAFHSYPCFWKLVLVFPGRILHHCIFPSDFISVVRRRCQHSNICALYSSCDLWNLITLIRQHIFFWNKSTAFFLFSPSWCWRCSLRQKYNRSQFLFMIFPEKTLAHLGVNSTASSLCEHHFKNK